EMEWGDPVEIREIHIWFDTGFQRQLTLSQDDSTNKTVIRAPQPETVKEYIIEIDGQGVVIEKNNYQRKRVHVLPKPVRGSKLRVTVMATHGVEEARVFELRVY